jgi:hypothetical protein
MPVQKAVRLSNGELLALTSDTVRAAEAENITLRATGGLAVYIRAATNENVSSLYSRIGRIGADGHDFGDIDFVGISEQETSVQQFFAKRGYEPDRYVNALFSGSRNMFLNRENGLQVDIFYDALRFSHDVVICDRNMNRLAGTSLTLLPTDLMLSKLQIHDVTRKDLLDMMILQLCHDCVPEENGDSIDLNYISSILSDDWGFYFDALNNLGKLKELSSSLSSEGVIGSSIHAEVLAKTETLLESIQKFPKTRNWEKRARKGTRKMWYREVDEI